MPPLSRVAICIAALLLLAGAAGAADGDPYLKGCFATSGAAPCTLLQPPFAATDAELSPDARHLYAAVAGGITGVRLFDVDSSGTFVPRPGAAATTPQAPQDVDLSADGRTVYLSAGDQFVGLSRDAPSGALTQLECFGAAPCKPVTGLSSFSSAAVSPDGRSVYARGANQLIVFDRDPVTGLLTQKLGLAGCLGEEGAPICGAAAGIAGTGLETVVSPDGRHLYVSNEAPGGVAVFSRDATGTLAQLPGTGGGCVTIGGSSGSSGGTECASGAPTLAQAHAVNIDAKGEFVIVSAAAGNTVFRRDASNGVLSQTDCLDELGGGTPPTGCHEVKGAAGGDAAFSPEGVKVALNARDFGISAFRFERLTGKLAQRPSHGCFSATAGAPCEHVPGLMGGLGSVTFSPNGRFLFAALRGGSIAGFENDLAPTCQAKTLRIPRNATVSVPLACTDANGDQLKLEIAAPPSNGSLGIVDQTRKRVSYRPETNYKGRDVFQYRGNARGTRGTPAIVTINVLARGRLIDRKPPNTRIKGGTRGTTRSRTARFRFISTEKRSRFECKLDKKRFARCRTPKIYKQLRRGRHTFQVRAVDRAGNVDLTPARRTWIRKR
jgi:hypothetical protein